MHWASICLLLVTVLTWLCRGQDTAPDDFRPLPAPRNQTAEVALAGMPKMFVSHINPHCDFDKPFGPVCNMTGVDAALSVGPDLMIPGALEVEVHNANAVFLYSVCVPWVQLYGVRAFDTLRQEVHSLGKPCRTWLRAHDSNLGALSDNIRDLSLVDSTVNLIDLHDQRDILAIRSNVSVIHHLDWRGFAGQLRDSHIGNVVSLVCNENVTITGVHIENVEFGGILFAGVSTTVNNTRIQKVSVAGITVENHETQFVNTVFGFVRERGIIVKSGATMKMYNVSIENCTLPCLSVPFVDSIVFDNVTVSGKPITDVYQAVHYSEDDDSTVKHVNIEERPECIAEDGNLACDFHGVLESIIITQNTSLQYSNVTITNANDLHVIDVCKLNLIVTKSNVVYSRRHSNAGNLISPCQSGGSITATNVTLDSLVGSHLQSLKMSNSFAHKLHIGRVEQMDVRGGLLNLYNVTVGEARWQETNMLVDTANVQGQLQADGIYLSISSILSLEGSNNSISNSDVRISDLHGLVLRRELSLRNVTLLDNFLQIYVEDEGSLQLQDMEWSRSFPAISVARMDQVTWIGATQDAPSYMVSVRLASEMPSKVTLAGHGQPHCPSNSMFPWVTRCNYTGVENVGTVYVHSERASFLGMLSVVGAPRLVLADVCNQVIMVLDVAVSVDMYDVPHHCRYSLTAENAVIQNITNEPTNLVIGNSTVAHIASSYPIRKLDLNGSLVERLDIKVALTQIRKTNVAKIDMLLLQEVALIDRANIGIIDGLMVIGQCQITNSELKSISTAAVTVKVKLVLRNVTIGLLDHDAISVEDEAVLSLENVTIKEGYIDSFNIVFGNINLKNVTLNGYPLTLSKVLHVEAGSVTPPASTLMPLTKSTPPAGVVSTPAAVSPTFTTLQPSINQSSVPSVPLSSDETGTQPWVQWARAGAAIFLTLVVVLIALSVLFLLRTHRRGEPLTRSLQRLFKRNSKEEPCVKSELDISLDRELTTTHYMRLPTL